MSVPYAPQVVAKQSFLDQTGLIAATDIFTAAETGDYLVSAYITQDLAATGSVVVNITWTDERAESTPWFFATNPGPAGTPVFSVHLPEGHSLQLQTINAGDAASYPYDVYVTVIQA